MPGDICDEAHCTELVDMAISEFGRLDSSVVDDRATITGHAMVSRFGHNLNLSDPRCYLTC